MSYLFVSYIFTQFKLLEKVLRFLILFTGSLSRTVWHFSYQKLPVKSIRITKYSDFKREFENIFNIYFFHTGMSPIRYVFNPMHFIEGLQNQKKTTRAHPTQTYELLKKIQHAQ